MPVTYFPDPAARRVALRLLDGPNVGFVETYPFGDPAAYPNLAAVRVVVPEGIGAPTFDAGTQTLRVPLEKGDVVHARLSAVLDLADLDQFALWEWVLDGLPPGIPGAVQFAHQRDLIERGQHWMFEPYRVLTLVHAVRQPLATPEFPSGLAANRGLGQTFALISPFVRFSRKSTSRIDMIANWQEPVDLGPGTAAPADVGQQGCHAIHDETAFTLSIEHRDELHPTDEQLRERHEFGDTKHRMVTYHAVATTGSPSSSPRRTSSRTTRTPRPSSSTRVTRRRASFPGRSSSRDRCRRRRAGRSR